MDFIILSIPAKGTNEKNLEDDRELYDDDTIRNEEFVPDNSKIFSSVDLRVARLFVDPLPRKSLTIQSDKYTKLYKKIISGFLQTFYLQNWRGLYDVNKDLYCKLGKLDQKIEKDVLLNPPISVKVTVENACQNTVPSVAVHNGSPSAQSDSVADTTSSETFNKNSKKEFDDYTMSLGDETTADQHGPTMNNVTPNQRPINCSAVPPALAQTVVLPVKQNTLPALSGGNRTLNKPGPINRMKIERSLSKQDSFDTEDVTPPHMHRMRHNSKVKVLQRSHAMREETSPPRDPESGHFSSPNINMNEKLNAHKTVNGIHSNNSNKVGSTSTKTGYIVGSSLHVNNNSLNRPNSRHKLRHQGSSQGSADSSSPCLSRDSSTEQYTDNSGVDLSQFIAETINKNNKDRLFLLHLESDLISLQKDPKRGYQKFPAMPSYQRMLVHRVAAFFGMDHNVDPAGNCVIVTVTPSTRIPDIRFSDLIRKDGKFSEEPKRCILKRDSNSFEEGAQIRSPERQLCGDSRRSKSFEEREEEYEKARKRIFNRDDGVAISSSYRGRYGNSRPSSHEDLRWQGDSQPWSSSDSELFNSKIRPNFGSRSSRIIKMESFEGHDSLKANSLRGSVSKSYSFGGYPGMSRGDSSSFGTSRVLMKQDSVPNYISSVRLNTSGGFKPRSARSDVTPTTTSSPNQITSQSSFSPEPNTVLWAVSSINAVPPGAVLINPISGQPYTNPDGSLYRYDPDNPLKFCPAVKENQTTYPVSSPQPAGANASTVEYSQHVITEKAAGNDTAVQGDVDNSSEVTNNKPDISEESSSFPSLPEPVTMGNSVLKDGAEHSESGNEENANIKGSTFDEKPQNDLESVQPNNPSNSIDSNIDNSNNINNSNTDNNNIQNNSNNNINNSNMEPIPPEVAQDNFNVIECENNYIDDGDNSTCQIEEEYGERNDAVSYQVNYSPNCNVQSDYGSQPGNSSVYANSPMGVTSINYAVGSQYQPDSVQMSPEAAVYQQQVLYNTGQGNPYSVVQTSAPGSQPNYEVRPNESNPTMGVPELSNYFMGLNVNSEQAPQATNSTPQYGYWSQSSSTSQTQGSNQSSQIQVYYVPGNVSAGTVHPKYTPAAPSMYTYNVPPMVYPTEICQSVMSGATNTVFAAPYYPSASNTSLSYRAPTPQTPTAVATAATVAPTSFFVYHPQASAPPAPPSVQFGMVRTQQQVSGIRSSPPPAPRARMPHGRSERARHPLNVEAKTPSLHFSSPLSLYGLRFMPGDIQSIGMVRPLGSSRHITPNSSHAHYSAASHSFGCDSFMSATRIPKPRKQRWSGFIKDSTYRPKYPRPF